MSKERLFLGMASALLFFAGNSAKAQELRNINNQFKSESGCPVEVVSAKTTLEIDPIGTPMACRIYIDYKNNSAKSVSGVKFRIGYIDQEDKIRGTFHAPDGHLLSPGSQASAKWRGEKIDPRTNSVMIRVLVAKFSDGSIWESQKLKELAPGTGGDVSNSSSNYASPPALEDSASSKPGPASTDGSESGQAVNNSGDSFETGDLSRSSPKSGDSDSKLESQGSSTKTEPANAQAPAEPESKASPVASPSPSAGSTDGY